MSPSSRWTKPWECSRTAGTSEPTMFSPSPRPTMMGLPRRAATMVSCALEEDGDGVGALDAGEGLGDAVDGAAGLLEEVGDDLGVGLGAEAVASATELLSEGVVVLDAAVVDDGDAAGAVEVGVRVELGGSADGGPTGVTDADARRGRGRSGRRGGPRRSRRPWRRGCCASQSSRGRRGWRRRRNRSRGNSTRCSALRRTGSASAGPTYPAIPHKGNSLVMSSAPRMKQGRGVWQKWIRGIVYTVGRGGVMVAGGCVAPSTSSDRLRLRSPMVWYGEIDPSGRWPCVEEGPQTGVGSWSDVTGVS